ncbi:MAG: ABC transporter permease, partial [Gemmatimonadaceae bacterium]
MSLWRQLARGVRVLTHRRAEDGDLTDELRHFAEQSEAEHMRVGGMSQSGAHRAAQQELGNLTVAREQVRSYGWENVVSTGIADLRYAARRLRHTPGFTAVSVITLALGIGASTAIFSAVNPILFQSLPYPQANRITMISDATAQGQPLDVTFGTYRELAQRSKSFSAMAPFKPWQPTMLGNAEPERLAGQRVGAGFLRALGVAPVLGRDFTADDDRAGGPNVVILSDALWRRHFSADPGVVGHQVKLEGNEYTVIGVMPAGFENVLSPLAQVWAPLQYNTAFGPNDREWGHHLRLVARLRPGVTLNNAKRELASIAQSPSADFVRVPWAKLDRGLIATSLQANVTSGIRPALVAVLGAVLLLLAIACVNVTNLLLARGAQRRGEFAMRAALGAGRSRLVRQMLTESLTLALLGGAVGLAVAQVGVRALVALSPPELPRLSAIGVSGSVFAFGMLLTTIIGLAVGIVPALAACRGDLRGGIDTGSRRTAGAHTRTRNSLVVSEVALALVLLVSAGLLLRSIERVFAVPV